jgi:AraC-like DNA-binding protein
MGFAYHQLAPPPDLAHVIDAYWVNSCEAAGGRASTVLPDGCIDLVLRAEGAARSLQASALTTEPFSIPAVEGRWFVGARFRPAMSRVVLDVLPAECRGEAIEAFSFDGSFAALARRIASAGTPREALDSLRAEVELRARANARLEAPPRVRRALALLRGDRAPSSSELARQLGMTERSLQRELVCWAGLPPKALARIFRMERAAGMIRGGGRALALVALDAGYADQPHMTREFRRLTGRAPGEHLRP